MSDQNDKIGNLQERIAVVENTVKTAHTRIDKMELLMRDDLRDIKKDIKDNIDGLTDKVNLLINFMERWKGMVAIAVLGCGVVAFFIQTVLSTLFKIWVK